MNEKIEKVKIEYLTNSSPRIVPKFDDWIEDQFKILGYEKWASGCNLETGWRDLAFDKKKSKGNK